MQVQVSPGSWVVDMSNAELNLTAVEGTVLCRFLVQLAMYHVWLFSSMYGFAKQCMCFSKNLFTSFQGYTRCTAVTAEQEHGVGKCTPGRSRMPPLCNTCTLRALLESNQL